MGATDEHVTTRWDRMGVIFQGVTAVAVPISLIALIVGVFQFKSQQETNASQALNQQRQVTLDNYLNDISALVLSHGLSGSKPERAVKALAVARTDTAVRNLDGARRGILIRYLWEAGLIRGKSPVVYLHKADLDGAFFKNAYLYDANLGTDFLAGANFYGADLHGADLTWADLSKANLSKVNLGCITTNQFDVSVTILAQARTTSCADLKHANLSDTDLQGADLVGANLSRASLAGTDLKGARYNADKISLLRAFGSTAAIPATQWPPNFDPQAKGAICIDC
jgi:uncharacterized protein YjbI with pentapeptide repeats